MAGHYREGQLARFGEIGAANKQLADKFFEYYGAVFAPGKLTEREKALIALAVAHTIQCPYCIEAYSGGCIEKGADAEEMMEALHVAAAIRGGASLVHGVQMLEHLEEAGKWPSESDD